MQSPANVSTCDQKGSIYHNLQIITWPPDTDNHPPPPPHPPNQPLPHALAPPTSCVIPDTTSLTFRRYFKKQISEERRRCEIHSAFRSLITVINTNTPQQLQNINNITNMAGLHFIQHIYRITCIGTSAKPLPWNSIRTQWSNTTKEYNWCSTNKGNKWSKRQKQIPKRKDKKNLKITSTAKCLQVKTKKKWKGKTRCICVYGQGIWHTGAGGHGLRIASV